MECVKIIGALTLSAALIVAEPGLGNARTPELRLGVNPYCSVTSETEPFLVLSPIPDAARPPRATGGALPVRNNLSAAPSGVRITILAPSDGLSLNASSVRVRAHVEVPSHTRLLSIYRVQLSLDGSPVAVLRPRSCEERLLADFRVDLEPLAVGQHQLTVTAVLQRRWIGLGPRMAYQASAGVSLTLDRSLPKASVNKVEEIATPAPLMCLSAKRSGARHLIQGRLTLGSSSDGLNPANERFVMALGTQAIDLPAGSFRCQPGECQYVGAPGSPIRRATLTQRETSLWDYGLELAAMPPAYGTVHLRIGNDWGGVNLKAGTLATGLEARLNDGRSVRGTIGPAGGTVAATDAGGVAVRLVVPPGALTADTDIAVTPLLSSPLAGYAGAIHPGIRLEPAGLAFARPATLTLDFSGSGRTVGSRDFIFLLTSPLTALPLVSHVDGSTLSAPINHFSTYEAGSGSDTFSELAAWGDPILESHDQPTLSEIQSLLALAALQQAEGGCNEGSEGCLDLGYLSDWAMSSIEVLMGEACQQGLLDPSDEWLQKLLELWAMYEGFGGSGGDVSAMTCIDEILAALIEEEGDAALASPTDANLQDLADHMALAAQLGLDALQDLAAARIKAALGAMVDYATELCGTDEEAGREELQRAGEWAELIGNPADLAGAIQSALDACGSVQFEFVAQGNPPSGWNPLAMVMDNFGDEGHYASNEITVDTRIPVSVSASTPNGSITMSAYEPSDGLLAVDAFASTSCPPGYYSYAAAQMEIWARSPRYGFFIYEANLLWGITDAEWMVPNLGCDSSMMPDLGRHELCAALWRDGIRTYSEYFEVDAGEVVRLYFNISVNNGSGSGRLFTLRWSNTPPW